MKLSSEERVLDLDPVFGVMGIEAGRLNWESPNLAMREKAVLLFAADVGASEFGLPFELHIGMGINQAGMQPEDLREVLRHLASDAGYGVVAIAFGRLRTVLHGMGLSVHSDAVRTDPAPDDVYPDWAVQQLQGLDIEFAKYAMAQARQVWNRPHLSRRERCLASIALDITQGTLGENFKVHLFLAASAGLAEDELRTAIRILAEFSVSKAWNGFVAFRRHLAGDSR